MFRQVPFRHGAEAALWTAAVGSPDAYAGELHVAYVQLKPGTAVTEAELLEHAGRTIPEKAAIPKRIKISSSLPTTAVGKLFKPALVEREIEEAIRAEAARIGATIASIRLDRDPRTGLRAVVEASDGADRLKEALDRYAVKSEVTETRRSTALPSPLRGADDELQLKQTFAPESGGTGRK